MPSTLAQFTLGSAAASDDFLVGYDTATLGGERRWTVSTMANAISGIMTTQLNNVIDSRSQLILPTGVVSYFASSTAPQGWIECNGAAITVATGYINLRNFLIAAGSPFGISAGEPLAPNIRGIFIRASGNQVINTITYSATFAAKQNDAVITHTHSYSAPSAVLNSQHVNTGNFNVIGHVGSTAANTGNPSTGTSSETRPANISLLACIKL